MSANPDPIIDAAVADLVRAAYRIPGRRGRPCEEVVQRAAKDGVAFLPEHVRIATMVIDTLGWSGAYEMVNREFPEDHAMRLFEEYQRAYMHETDADANPRPTDLVIRKAEGLFGTCNHEHQSQLHGCLCFQRGRFHGLVDTWLVYCAPTRMPSPERRAELEEIIGKVLEDQARDEQLRRELGFGPEDVT